MKNFYTIQILIIFVLNILFTNIGFASGIDIELNSFTISRQSGDVYVNPGDSIGIGIGGKNKGDDASNVGVSFGFSDNNFTYLDQGTVDSYITFAKINENIPVSVFDPLDASKRIAPITTSSSDGDLINLQTIKLGIPSNRKEYLLNVSANFIADGYAGDVVTHKVYVNVKPHIVDYSFSESSIKNNGLDQIDLTVKVKDYNGCDNINGGTVKADLSKLGLGNELLTYISCESGNIGVFKKEGIGTTKPVGDITFDYSLFTATDEDGNVNDASVDTSFTTEDKKSDLLLTISTPLVPVVTISSISEEDIGPQKTTSQITFTGDKAGEYKIVVNGNGSCSSGTVVKDWTSYTISSSVDENIQLSQLPIEGLNTIHVCVKGTDGIGSANIGITKDTVVPVISNVIVSPGNVTTQNSQISFKCSSNGKYKVEKVSPSTFTLTSWTDLLLGTKIDTVITNDRISSGSNTVQISCKDKAGNIGVASGNVSKQNSSPSMNGKVASLTDTDTSWEGVDGKDIKILWNTSEGVGFAGFESYKIYLLPSATAFNKNTHNAIGIITDKTAGEFIGGTSIKKDSAGNDLVQGTYKAYVAIQGVGGELGIHGEVSGQLVSDTVVNPEVISAKFTSKTNLEITFNATLNASASEHLSHGPTSTIKYTIGSTVHSGISVASIDDKIANITIPEISGTAGTGTNLTLGTGAIRGVSGGYNLLLSGINISDGIDPVVAGFKISGAPDSSPVFENSAGGKFYSGNVGFEYNFSETLKRGGATKFEFIRESGNDDFDTHLQFISGNNELEPGLQTYSLNISGLGLKAGTCYKTRIVGEDLAGNTFQTSYITNICYDDKGPSSPVLVPFPDNLNENDNYSSVKRPKLEWFTSADGSNESGFKEYEIEVSLNSLFTPVFVSQKISGTSYTFNQDLGSASGETEYFWRVKGIDNAGNTSSGGVVSDFIIDYSSATITNIKFNSITDGINNIDYFPKGKSISITANVLNSSGACIIADLTGIGLGTGVLATTYSGGIATFTGVVIQNSITEGLKSIKISAKNNKCIGDYFENSKDIGIDSTPPAVGVGITFPSSGDFVSGLGTETVKIKWDTASIVEHHLEHIRLSLFNGSAWIIIGDDLQNLGEFDYKFPNLNVSNAKLKLEVFDKARNVSEKISDAFLIDSVIPVLVGTSVLTYPNSGESFKGGENINILWDKTAIPTGASLSNTPISLYYSIDGGSSFTLIAENLSNSGTGAWTVPDSTTDELQIKLVVTDKAGNKSFDLLDSNFSSDNSKPTITFSRMLDLDKNGNIDTLEVVFSEKIKDSSVKTERFALDNGYAITSAFNPTLLVNGNNDIADNEKVYFSLTEKSKDTGVELKLSYVKAINNNLGDYVGNELDDVSNLTVADSAAPVILQREVLDANGDGTLDQVKITFSETIDASKVGVNDFEIKNFQGTFVRNYDNTQTDSNALILLFTGGLAFNTGDEISVKLKRNNFEDLSGNGIAVDSAFVVSTNRARPIFKAKTQIAESGTGSQIKVEFSEKIDPTSTTGTWVFSDGITVISSIMGTGSIIFNTSDITNTGLAPTVQYVAGTSIKDIHGNFLTPGTVTAKNKILPLLANANFLDENSNGSIEKIELTFSTNVKDSTLSAIGDFKVGGVSATSFTTGTADDKNITILFSTEVKGTGKKDLTFAGGTLSDMSGNMLEAFSSSGSEVGFDKAGPAIISVYLIEGDTADNDEIIVNFSEDIKYDTLALSDFAIEGTGSLAGGAISEVAGLKNQIKIKLTSASTKPEVGISKLKFSGASAIEDLNLNGNSQTQGVIVNGSVIINEINWAGSSASADDEYIELRNMSSKEVSISEWVIENATNGGNITIPAGSVIQGRGYFLIANFAKTDTNSRLNVDPDMVDTNLDLADTGNGNLVLKNDRDNLMDSAKGDVWAKGDLTKFYSMERTANSGDGLNEDFWYTASGRGNLDNLADGSAGAEKGTPGAANIFDSEAPVFTADTEYPRENKLFLFSKPEISIEFSDEGTGINTVKSKMYLDWDGDITTGTGGCEVKASSGVAVFTQDKVTVTPSSAMAGGRKRACVSVFDNAGNEAKKSWDFWIEDFQFKIEETNEFNEVLTPSVDEIFEDKIKITIKTYGAGVKLNASISDIVDGGNKFNKKNIFYNSKVLKKIGTGTFQNFKDFETNDLSSTGVKLFDFNKQGFTKTQSGEEVSVEDDEEGKLKTYEIYLRHKFNISVMQETGNYKGEIKFTPTIIY